MLLTSNSIGYYFFHIGLLLREINLVNGILFGAEAWYGVTKSQIEKLESSDLNFFRRLFSAHSKTSKESFHLETGKIMLRHILINRRLMFWHHIINRKKDSLLYKFYKIQKVIYQH